ncbi:histone deacetylase 8-like [Oratosquilla oratoria]|uniref:histone deacetylase 8-like n=1 Tax=Oratosquilla oratoria TaxID=337810 RepID=UPI003F762E37
MDPCVEMSEEETPRVAYILDPVLTSICDCVRIIKHRTSLTHGLVTAYNLMEKMQVIPSVPATEAQIRMFHSEEYINFLKRAVADEENKEEDRYGLGFDCPVLSNMWKIASYLAGSSLTAANVLVEGKAKVVINWCGGWHHAQRDMASGFCYVNDIVLAIQQLRTKFDKVLYIDLDVHHGDGVESAFLDCPKVMTLSLHLFEPGFFPGTGGNNEVHLSRKGQYSSINAPYKAAITDKQFIYLFESLLRDVYEVFSPDVVVCQCGGDALSGDPLGGANITEVAYQSCIRNVLGLNKPTLILGGGGYNRVNTAKCWTVITATVLGIKQLPSEIPEHKYFPVYGPSFELEITPSLRKSENTLKSLNDLIHKIQGQIKQVSVVSPEVDVYEFIC